MNKFKDFIPLIIIILAAISIRLYLEFSTKMMPGIMAVYYPVQVRALLETGGLGFSDLPFVFYLEAGLAKIIQFFGNLDLSSSIMTSSKIIDSIVYPLIAIPFYLLTRQVLAEKNILSKWIPVVISILATLSISAMIMTADFQKNSIGLTWSMFFIYFLYMAIQKGGWKYYLSAIIFLILICLTHLGAIGFAISLMVCYFVLLLICDKEKRQKLFKILIILIALVVCSLLFLYILDSERAVRLLSAFFMPYKLFDDPMIFGMISGKVPSQPHLLINALFANILGVVGLIFCLKKKDQFLPNQKALLLSAIITALFMASPFLGEEWGNRVYLMAYIPAIIIAIFLLIFTYTKWKQILITVFMLLYMLLPIPFMWNIRETMSITEEAYEDLYNVKKAIEDPSKTLVIVSTQIDWWTAWILETDITHGRDLTMDNIAEYAEIYYLRQESGKGNFGEFGPGSSPFPEIIIPQNAKIKYSDKYFTLAIPPDKPPKVEYDK